MLVCIIFSKSRIPYMEFFTICVYEKNLMNFKFIQKYKLIKMKMNGRKSPKKFLAVVGPTKVLL